MNDRSLPSEFEYILKLCKEEQGLKLLKVRNYILDDGRAKEHCKTRWIKYGRKSKPCIEIRFEKGWDNPKILLKLPKIDVLNQLTSKKCKYGLSVQKDGNYENFLELYQIQELKREGKLPINTIDTIIHLLATSNNDSINQNDKDKLIILLELALNADKYLSS
jgi:hypothetical protein